MQTMSIIPEHLLLQVAEKGMYVNEEFVASDPVCLRARDLSRISVPYPGISGRKRRPQDAPMM